MKKYCVFCGNTPKNKNKEHVLPQWLLGLTGDPKRVVNMAFNSLTGKVLRFDWSSLVAPSCKVCNDEFSEFENKAKEIIENLVSYEPVNGDSYLILLDWLDKVRIGLWLNYFYLQENPMGIIPQMFIKSRMGMKDRMLALYRFPNQPNGLNAFGVNSLSFQTNPSCFGLRINNILLFNMSSDFLFSKRVGFPYPKAMFSKKNDKGDNFLHCMDWDITRRIQHPLIRKHIADAAIHIYQPIMMKSSNRHFQGGFLGHFNIYDNYLAENCLPPYTEGKGKLFRQYLDRVEVVDNMSTAIEFDDNKSEKLAFPSSKIIDQISQFQMDIYRNSEWRFDDAEQRKVFEVNKKRVLASDESDRKALMEHMKKVGTVGT